MKKTIAGLLFVFILVLSLNPVEAALVHYVQRGDTLWKVANMYDTTVEEIAQLNNSINSSYQIYVGQRLLVPGQNDYDYNYPSNNDNDYDYNNDYDNDYNYGKDYSSNYGYEYSVSYGNNRYTYYVVKPGDILWTIARKYDTTVERLISLNDIRDSYDLYKGRKLLVSVEKLSTEPVDENDNNTPDREAYAPYYLYTVRGGDSVTRIASRFGINVSELHNANQNMGQIRQGSVLVVPLENTDKLTYVRDTNWRVNNYYQVRDHESLSQIAQYFGLPEEGLRAINKLGANERVRNFQVLLMPVNRAFFNQHDFYTVKRDTTPKEVAAEKAVSLQALLKANYMRNENYPLKAATTLIIPKA